MAQPPDATDLSEAQTRAETAAILAASLQREMDELRSRLHDEATVRTELAHAHVAIAERDLEIATVKMELRDVFQGMVRPEDQKGHPRARARKRRDEDMKRRRPERRTTEARGLDQPLALAVPTLRWIGEVVEAD